VVLLADAWTPATGDHPFTAGAPADGECPEAAYGEEGGFFEVETDLCAWAVFTQPLAHDVAAGDTVEWVSWHLDLWAQVETTARVVLQVDDEVLWDQTFAVPGPDDINALTLTVAGDHAADTPAWWHIANHGYNSWRLSDVEATPAAR
jgi:plastocyanin